VTTAAPPSWDLVVFSDDWGRRPSAPQHLGRHLAVGRRVLWVEPAGLRRPRVALADLRRGAQKMRGFLPGGAPASDSPWLPTPASLTRLIPPVLPAYGVGAVRLANDALMGRAVRSAMARAGIVSPVVITTIPTMAGVLGSLGERASIYLRMDDFGQWPGYDHDAIAERESALLRAVDALVAPSKALLDLETPARKLLLPHGVDAGHFAVASGVDPLGDVPRPRVLVSGRLDERIDFELLRGLLAEPDLQLVLLGEDHCVPDDLTSHPRVHLRAAVPYGELGPWLLGSDVHLMPYACTALGHSLAPLKTRELLATGLPVVSTPVAGVRDDDEAARWVGLATGAQQARAAIKACLAEPARLGVERRAAMASLSWESRAARLSDLVQRLLTSAPL